MKTEHIYQLFRESAGVSTDSRTVTRNQIFFALWGENYNGNKFASEAIDKGASWAVIDDPAFETDKTILVEDCLFELQALAGHHRKEMKVPVLAITGTNGKTTTKELISAIISKKLRVHSTKGNLNNHIGVPLTILSAPEGTQMMIIEMGASHIGEIRTLCHIARPDFGLITNVGTAHIEGFGSFDGVLKAKTELYEYLRKTNGIAIYNDNDHLLTERIYKLVNRAVPYSDPTGIDLVVEPAKSDSNLAVSITYHHKTHLIETSFFGLYNLENIKAAIATGLFLEVMVDDIIDAVKSYQPGNNRSQFKKTRNNTLVCDAYNANPESMSLALDSFALLDANKKMCILGDMLELGEKSSEEHSKIIKVLRKNKLEDVLLAGGDFSRAAVRSGFRTFPDVGKLKEFLKAEQVKGYTILIKGSRGMRMEKVFDVL
jgi:UDP-N-acetylmuramoyl-tripeptide--D-alanyl-D-alanine ligase